MNCLPRKITPIPYTTFVDCYNHATIPTRTKEWEFPTQNDASNATTRHKKIVLGRAKEIIIDKQYPIHELQGIPYVPPVPTSIDSTLGPIIFSDISFNIC